MLQRHSTQREINLTFFLSVEEEKTQEEVH